MGKETFFGLGAARNLALLAQVATRHAVDDPALLVLQTARKLPRRAGRALGRVLAVLPGAGSRALGEQVLGAGQLPEAARRLLASEAASGWSRFQKRLAAEVAVGYGLVDYRDTSLPAPVRARAAWDCGAASYALELARQGGGSRAYAERLAGELAALSPDFWLETREPAATPAPATGGGKEPVALHLLTNSLPATQSGYTLRSHRLLLSLRQAGTRPLVFTRLGYPVMVGGLLATDTARVDGLTYRRLLPWKLGASLPARLQETVDAILQQIQGQRIDLVHTTTNYQNGLVAHALARSLGVPWVYEVRGVMEETWVSGKKTEASRLEAERSQRFQLLRARETQLCLAADAVVTLSQTMKNLLVSRGVPEEKITLAPNAVDPALFQQGLSPRQAREELGLPAEGYWVGTVSSLVPYEGLDTLLTAVALLREGGKDVRALIAGDGSDRPRLEALADQLNLGQAVVFSGRLAPAQALNAHQALDVFTVPRTGDRVCRSVTPLKPIEAMALGRPVVASDIPPLAELVNNDLAPSVGRLFEAENPASLAAALEGLLTDPQAYQKAVEQGKALAATRLWSHNAGALTDLYRKLLSKHG